MTLSNVPALLSRSRAPWLLAPLVLACASAPKNTGPAAAPSVEVDRIFPSAESLDASAVEVTLVLENPTDETLTVSKITYTVDTKDVGGVIEGSAESTATVGPGQKIELRFKQSIAFPADATAYAAVLERQTIPLSLEGSVVLSNGEEVDFERDGEVATPTLPKLIVNDSQAARYGSEGVDVTIFLRLVNDNPFAVLVQSCEYTIYIEDVEARSDTAAVGTRLLPTAGEEYEFSRQISGKDPKFGDALAKKMLASGKFNYRIEGKIDLARMTIPFKHEGTIELASGE